MNTQERQVIDDLFDKLAQAEQQAGPREPLAEAHIRSRIAAQPGAPYLMAQTIVMQTQALEAAQSKLASLEEELARRPAGGGGFLSSLFGGGSSPRETAAPTAASTVGTLRDAGFGSRATGQSLAQARQGRPGGGFLGGAAQTAMGVAGGMLLGSLIGSAFGGGAAHAAPAAAPEQDAAPAEREPEADMADDGGGDFGGDEI